MVSPCSFFSRDSEGLGFFFFSFQRPHFIGCTLFYSLFSK